MKTTPYPFQIEDAERIRRFDHRGLLASEMGTGKSLTALLAMHNGELTPTIVICPAHLRWVWENEARHHLGIRTEILEGTKPPPGRRLKGPIVVINYDILWGWLKLLRRLKSKLVIIDECHYLQSPVSLRTRAVRKLCRRVPHVIALSGTPLVNRPIELFPTLNILQPKRFKNRFSFGHRFCGPERTPFGTWTFNGASNTAQLHGILTKHVMVRRLKSEVLDLPAKRRIVVPLDIRHRDEYDRAADDLIGWLAERHPGKAQRAARAERMVRFGYLKRLAAKLKMQSVFAWVDDFLAQSKDDKIILFAVHRKIIAKLRDRYRGISVQVDGSVTGRDRQRAVEKFLKSRMCRVFVGNVRAAGTGWSAKGVSTVAFVEMDWTPGIHIQAEDRCHGISRGVVGQRTTIFYLVAAGTIESDLAKIIQRKAKILRATLDGEGRGEALDVFDLLTAKMKEKHK